VEREDGDRERAGDLEMLNISYQVPSSREATLRSVKLNFYGDADNTILSNGAACRKRRIKKRKVHSVLTELR
jgi:hypothetical protein